MMQLDPTVLVAGLTVLGSILTGAVSYFFTKRQQLAAQWRENKLTHYTSLLSAISDLAVDNSDKDAHRRFAKAVNTIALVAPQGVVLALLMFHDEVKVSNPERTLDKHDELLARLLMAIRSDLGIRPKDNTRTFTYHLVGAPSKSGRRTST